MTRASAAESLLLTITPHQLAKRDSFIYQHFVGAELSPSHLTLAGPRDNDLFLLIRELRSHPFAWVTGESGFNPGSLAPEFTLAPTAPHLASGGSRGFAIRGEHS